MTKKLTAQNLKESLWETLNTLKDGSIEAAQADSIAGQAREILRTVNTELRITNQAKRPVTTHLIDFAEKD
jgi:hypothetical protein